MSTARADMAVVTTVIDVELTLNIDVPDIPPNITDEVSAKFIPVIVTIVSPKI